MGRQRVNPFDPGTAERVLFDRFRRSDLAAKAAERARDLASAEADAYRAAATKYAAAARLEQRPKVVVEAIAGGPIERHQPVFVVDGGRCRHCGAPR